MNRHRGCNGHSGPSESSGISTRGGRAVYRELVGKHFSDCSGVFLPYASDDHDSYTERMPDFMGGEAPSSWESTSPMTRATPGEARVSSRGLVLR